MAHAGSGNRVALLGVRPGSAFSLERIEDYAALSDQYPHSA